MKTKYKWIEFEERPNPKRKTTKWKCINTSLEELGDVYWLTTWRQYVFLANFECEFNNRCLVDIADFLTQLNKKQRVKE